MGASESQPWIALVGPEEEENLALRYLASSLAAAGFRSEIVGFNGADQLPLVLDQILSAPLTPLLTALSLSFQLRAKDFLALAVALRQRGYRGHITAGGHFGTFACRELLQDFPELDSIVRHEAEETLVRLALAVADAGGLGAIPGLAYRDTGDRVVLTQHPTPPALDALPWPDRRGTPPSYLGHRISPMVGSRGCYGACSFCCIAAWHREASPHERFRLRPAQDVAHEMAWLQREKGVEVFIFHDDNFFLPTKAATMERIGALGDALERRGLNPFATVVKARPNDLDEEVLSAMRERLGLIRLFLGVESDAGRGLATLARGVRSEENHRALGLLERLDIFPCFNLLIFDPSTTLEDLETNLRFMERFAEIPMNFGRVKLYAGTPLLARMQAEGRCRGDYLEWDYSLGDESVQRIFEIAMDCFYPRNFSGEATPHRLMGTRFLVELARRFHGEVVEEPWLARAKQVARNLTEDSVKALREILDFVRQRSVQREERETFTRELSLRLREAEGRINEKADALEAEIQAAVLRGRGGDHEEGEGRNEANGR